MHLGISPNALHKTLPRGRCDNILEVGYSCWIKRQHFLLNSRTEVKGETTALQGAKLLGQPSSTRYPRRSRRRYLYNISN